MTKRNVNRLLIILLIIGAILLFKFLNLGDYFSIAYIKASRERFEALYAARRFSVIAAFMAVYVLVTSLSLPGAAVLTLAGGALFGLWAGTVIVSFASSIGATLACLASRYILRDWVQRRFGEKLKRVNEGIGREGAFYLFTLRLVPVFPFWLINMVMGLTRMPLRTFYWVSQLGMIPGTIVYVNAGKELGKIDSISGIFSPGLIISFALLGVFPIAAKKTLAFYKSKKKGAS
jgi:uncharacterized membrane protein YdjX (TVP38/TMEM64 family)